MADSYIVHVSRLANDAPEYITGHIEVAATGYKHFFSSHNGLLRALSVIATAEQMHQPAKIRPDPQRGQIYLACKNAK